VQIENSGRACALAQLWTMSGQHATAGDLVFVSVSDGVGLGVIIHGEMLRGRNNVAGEFGHAPLSLDGPRCSCGATGCWEAYISNRATLARYFGRAAETGPVPADQKDFTVEDLIARARSGDTKAAAAIQATGRYLGLGLATVINGLDPARVFIGGEITAAWDLIEASVREALLERALTPGAEATDIQPVAAIEYPRLRGAAALVTAPAFAAPVVA
jgi:predicted NBD/HSP70 family sugar kinase